LPYIPGVAEVRHTVAETRSFLSQAKDEGMSEAEREAIVSLVSNNPEAGELIIGSGGCRKLRVAKAGGGKSGGYRVVTFFSGGSGNVYLVAVLAKGSRATFNQAEVNAMATLAKAIKAAKSDRKSGLIEENS